MLSAVQCIFDIMKWAGGNENPKVGWEFRDFGKTLLLQFTGEYAEKVPPRLHSAALVQRFNHDQDRLHT
jgi:hypothetical protein